MDKRKLPHSKEHRIKIGLANKGKIRSIEARENMREKMKGKKPWNTDKKLSEEHKLKISEAHKGQIPSQEARDNMSKAGKGKHKYWLDKKMSEEHKEKISESNKGKKPSIEHRKHLSETRIKNRENYPNWKGGITEENIKVRNSIEIRLAREACFARDNYTCQKTGVRGGKIRAHHINNFSDFPELRFAIDNLITLSDESHRLFHKIYGRRNNTLEQLIEFLKN